MVTLLIGRSVGRSKITLLFVNRVSDSLREDKIFFLFFSFFLFFFLQIYNSFHTLLSFFNISKLYTIFFLANSNLQLGQYPSFFFLILIYNWINIHLFSGKFKSTIGSIPIIFLESQIYSWINTHDFSHKFKSTIVLISIIFFYKFKSTIDSIPMIFFTNSNLQLAQYP